MKVSWEEPELWTIVDDKEGCYSIHTVLSSAVVIVDEQVLDE